MKDLSECDEPTLRQLTDKGGPICARWCRRCDHHYRFCSCEDPAWAVRVNGTFTPMPGEPGGPKTLEQLVNEANGPTP